MLRPAIVLNISHLGVCVRQVTNHLGLIAEKSFEKTFAVKQDFKPSALTLVLRFTVLCSMQSRPCSTTFITMCLTE